MKVISVDLGATSGRVMTVTLEGGKFSYVENARFLNKVYRAKDGVLRWDFPYLLSHVIEGIQKALEASPDALSIGIDTWGVDFGLIKDGKLIENPACYRDERTFDSQKRLLQKIPFSKIYEITGIQNLHINTIYQLYAEKTDFKNVDQLLLIPDLIAYFLTGSARMEETMASTTSLYDQKEKKISSELLKEIGVPERIFPKMIHAGEAYGNLKKEYLPAGFKRDIPVLAVCTHDTASAVLGANGKGQFAYISSGTWSLIGTEAKKPIINEESRKANFTNEIGYASSIRFLKNAMGMFLINEVRNDYASKGEEIKVSSIKPLVDEAEDMPTYLNIDDPLFETPGNMLAKVKEYTDREKLPYPDTPGKMMKVIYRSMAFNYRKTIEQLKELTSLDIRSILIVGGGNQATVLNQYTADACNVMVQTGAHEATAMGNALAQFLAAGVISSVEEGREAIGRSIDSSSYFPKNKEEWDKMYSVYLQQTE